MRRRRAASRRRLSAHPHRCRLRRNSDRGRTSKPGHSGFEQRRRLSFGSRAGHVRFHRRSRIGAFGAGRRAPTDGRHGRGAPWDSSLPGRKERRQPHGHAPGVRCRAGSCRDETAMPISLVPPGPFVTRRWCRRPPAFAPSTSGVSPRPLRSSMRYSAACRQRLLHFKRRGSFTGHRCPTSSG